MSWRNSVFLFGAAGLMLMALSAQANPAPPIMPGNALILTDGSINAPGYLVYVSPKGSVQILKRTMHYGGGNFREATLPQALTKKLFHDLVASRPLTKIHTRSGKWSALFYTVTFITYQGQRSPDLTFGGDAHAVALRDDIQAIVKSLRLDSIPRHSTMP